MASKGREAWLQDQQALMRVNDGLILQFCIKGS